MCVVFVGSNDSYAMQKTAEVSEAKAESYERQLVDLLDGYTNKQLKRELIAALKSGAAREEVSSLRLRLGAIPPLFSAYPAMQHKIPFTARTKYPTALIRTKCVPALHNLYIKLGSKEMRKLDFLLAEAYAHQRKKIIVFGGLGSDYVVEAASYAQSLGMQAICVYKAFPDEPKHDAAAVRRCLELVLDTNAKVSGVSETKEAHRVTAAEEFQCAKETDGIYPYLIPAGGSCPLARIGSVNLIFELNEQVKAGEMPEPDIIVSTHGDIATGLYLGIKAVKWKSHLLTIQLELNDEPGVLVEFIVKALPSLNTLLQKADSSFPHVDFIQADFESITGLNSPDYGAEAIALQKMIKENEQSDFTPYTAKSFAALLAYIEKTKKHNNTILFLNTTDVLAQPLNPPDLSRLPKSLHVYFH